MERGYRQPAGLFKTDDLQGRERLAGFLDALRMTGISVPDERVLAFSTEERNDLYDTPSGKRFLEMLLRREADCLVCYNDIFAAQLMVKLQERGMKLPEELGIIGFDNATFSGMLTPGLTTLGHPKEAFGALAARKILRMINGEHEDSVNMAWTLIDRESLPGKQK